MRASGRLPGALAGFGLLPPAFDGPWAVDGARVTPAPQERCVPHQGVDGSGR
jgi:hypothetical protein